jgi:hypothetical protein
VLLVLGVAALAYTVYTGVDSVAAIPAILR